MKTEINKLTKRVLLNMERHDSNTFRLTKPLFAAGSDDIEEEVKHS